MRKVYYDLHMHSCLSPCGENDMTPANIAGMAKLKELDVIALTDHNTCRNCAPLMHHAAQYGITVIPGMEINTREEIHAVCLFPVLEAALEFDRHVYDRLLDFQNDPQIYGRQYVMDEEDKILEEVPRLLISACGISIMELKDVVTGFGGVCFPAHIDKSAYSILSVLGGLPEECGFDTVEVARPQLIDSLMERHPALGEKQILTNSDAHYLWDISERYHSIQLEDSSIEAVLHGIAKGAAC